MPEIDLGLVRGKQGNPGTDGADATINGFPAINIIAGKNINIDQSAPGTFEISASFDTKGFIPTEEKGAVGGVATLDADGKLAEDQRPVYIGEDIPVSGSDDTSLSAALSNKADKSPPAWIDMPMTGDYTLTDNDKLQFGLNGAGETCICGLFKAPSTTEMSEQFATLPEGFRPKGKQMWIIAISSSTRAIFPVRIYGDGSIVVWLAKFPPSDTIVIPMQSFSAGQ